METSLYTKLGEGVQTTWIATWGQDAVNRMPADDVIRRELKGLGYSDDGSIVFVDVAVFYREDQTAVLAITPRSSHIMLGHIVTILHDLGATSVVWRESEGIEGVWELHQISQAIEDWASEAMDSISDVLDDGAEVGVDVLKWLFLVGVVVVAAKLAKGIES